MVRLRNPFNPISRRAFHALTVIEALERTGCRVIEAHAHTAPPVVRVDRQPSVVESYGFRAPPAGCVRVPVLCVAEQWGTRIEWFSKEANQ
jgi:hypothetical protein